MGNNTFIGAKQWLSAFRQILLLIAFTVSINVIFIRSNLKVLTENDYKTVRSITITTTITTAKPQRQVKRPSASRYLIGIFTTLNDNREHLRRQIVRRTFLRFYQDNYYDYNNQFPDQRHLICSLQDLYREGEADVLQENCLLVYAFIVGGYPEGPTELLPGVITNGSDYDVPLVLTAPPPPINGSTSAGSCNDGYVGHVGHNGCEDDIVYLNIRENMNDGKSLTFFSYGASVADELNIDFIVKMDTDAILFPQEFLRQLANFNLPKQNKEKNNSSSSSSSSSSIAIYGGYSWMPGLKPPCPPHPTKHFFSGHFYFVSTNLARSIVSPSCARQALIYNRTEMMKFRHMCKEFWRDTKDKAEDASFGNFVGNCHSVGPVRPVLMGMANTLTKQGPSVAHPIKDPHTYEKYYHLRNLIRRSQNIVGKNNNNGASAAICHSHKPLDKGDNIDLYSVMEWAVYHHLLGFDRIFVTYLAGGEKIPAFQELGNLPFVTLTAHHRKNGDKCDEICLAKKCLKEDATNYDWVLLADSIEFLWFNQTIGIKEFLKQNTQSSLMYFDHHIYSSRHRSTTTETTTLTTLQKSLTASEKDPSTRKITSGFYAENFPYRSSRQKYCKQKEWNGELCKSQWRGLSKVMVRPKDYANATSGNIFWQGLEEHIGSANENNQVMNITMKTTTTNNAEGINVRNIPLEHAHFKQWPGFNGAPSSSLLASRNFPTRFSGLSLDKEDWGRHSARSDCEQAGNGEKSHDIDCEELLRDDLVKDWFGFVAQRGALF